MSSFAGHDGTLSAAGVQGHARALVTTNMASSIQRHNKQTQAHMPTQTHSNNDRTKNTPHHRAENKMVDRHVGSCAPGIIAIILFDFEATIHTHPYTASQKSNLYGVYRNDALMHLPGPA